MEPWLVAIVVVVAVFAAAAGVSRAVQTRRRLDLIATEAGAPPGGDPAVAVTELRDRALRAETAASAAALERDAFLGSLAQGVLVVGDGLRITSANPAAHVLLDRAAGTLVGRTLMEVFLDTGVEAIAVAARAAGSSTGEVAVAGADGPRLSIRGRRTPAGTVWLVLEDVSELRRLQQIRTEFIDNLSHELRTPLTTVSLLAETLTREAEAAGDKIPRRMRERIDNIEVETGHLVQMVSELLDLSRIESGGALGPLEPVDLGALAEASVGRLRLFADRQRVTLATDVSGPLPAVRGDEDRLGQVMINLLHNAVKFSPDGGEVRVSVGTDATGDQVVVAVADHGVGIPRSAQARIFERFYKVDRARVRGEAGGTGLGLAIARHILEQHGGRIWVESTEAVGSTFSFSLPVASGPA
jgi:two-component system phosphate regulon sensor histidine kinase PhoR